LDIDKSEAFEEYRRIKRIKRKKLRQEEKRRETKNIKEIEQLKSKNPGDYWKKLYNYGKVHPSKEALPEIMKNKEGKLVNGYASLETWREAFCKLGQDDNLEIYDEQCKVVIERKVRKIERSQTEEKRSEELMLLNRPIEKEEVRLAIQRLKNGKAVGIDGITNELLRGGGEGVENAIWRLFNEIWKEEKFPQDWARGLIFPLFKRRQTRSQARPYEVQRHYSFERIRKNIHCSTAEQNSKLV
jgi:hypothetical protein